MQQNDRTLADGWTCGGAVERVDLALPACKNGPGAALGIPIAQMVGAMVSVDPARP